MSEEEQPEVAVAEGETPAKAKKEKTVSMVILRDFWKKGDLSPGDRVRAGTKVDVSVEDAMAGLESGAMRRATADDE